MRPIQIQPSITIKNEDSIVRYFRELEGLKPLKPEEEFELARRIQAGDKAALDKLVSANLRFVISIAKKHLRENRSLSDLINEGNLGLIEAAQRFDATRGFRFISFAVWWIRRAMLSGNGNQERVVRLPMNLVQGISAINQSKIALLQILEREPTMDEIAEHAGMDAEKVKDMICNSHHTVSLDRRIGEEGGNTLLDMIGDEDPSHKPDQIEQGSLRIEIKRAFTVLTAREQLILEGLFGLGTGGVVEIGELAEQLGMCRERIRQIKHRALEKLSKISYSKQLREYL
jgi:RNA polymerase primary sigma factor